MEMNELFYKDAYLKEFDAVVTSCHEGKNGFEVVLDVTKGRTASKSSWMIRHFILKAADSHGIPAP